MAGSAVIGSLRVNLGIDSAQFATGVKKAQSSLGVLGASLKAFAVGAVAALSVGAIGRAIDSVIDKADELGKTAQKIGIPVEELSKLEYAAKLADVSLEQLSTGVGKLSKNMAAIQGGNGGDAAKALRAIGVSATDALGRLRPTSEVMADIAEKFSRMRDGAGKTALAMAIFGKSGEELIPLLNAGKKGLADSAAEAEKLGIVISGPTAKAAEAFNDNLTRLHAAGAGLTTQVSAALLPALVDLTNAFVENVKNGELAKNIATAINFVMKESKRFLLEASAAWQEVTIWIGAANEVLGKLGEGDFLGSLEAFRLASRKIDEVWADTAARIAAAGAAVADLPSSIIKPPLNDAPNFTTDAGPKKLSEAFLQSQFDAKKLNDGVLNLSKSFGEVGESAQSLGSALAETFGQNMQDWFGQAIDGTFKLKDALGDLFKQLAKVAVNNLFSSLFTNASHPVQGGGLLGGIGKLFGFARGGSFKVGGAGGIDSQMVAFKASPNEQVSVTKPGQERGGSTVVANFYGSNNDATGMAMLRADFREFQQNFAKNVRNTVSGEKSLNPRFAR